MPGDGREARDVGVPEFQACRWRAWTWAEMKQADLESGNGHGGKV